MTPEVQAFYDKLMTPARLVDKFAATIRAYEHSYGLGLPDHKERRKDMEAARRDLINALVDKNYG